MIARRVMGNYLLRRVNSDNKEVNVNKDRSYAIGGLIGAVGLIVLLIGAMTDIYARNVVAALAIWVIGGAFARLVFAGAED